MTFLYTIYMLSLVIMGSVSVKWIFLLLSSGFYNLFSTNPEMDQSVFPEWLCVPGHHLLFVPHCLFVLQAETLSGLPISSDESDFEARFNSWNLGVWLFMFCPCAI